jgi:hypothetical protein
MVLLVNKYRSCQPAGHRIEERPSDFRDKS